MSFGKLGPLEIEGCSDNCVRRSRPSRLSNTANWHSMGAVEHLHLRPRGQQDLVVDIRLMGHHILLPPQVRISRMIWEEYPGGHHPGVRRHRLDNSILRRSD